MRYYAVTEDPNELFHYGVKGMKWGQHIFGDKPKSTGYRRALGKLRASVKKSKTQRAITKQKKQQDKYNKAVQKAQQRIQMTENLHTLDQMKTYQNGINQQYRQERKAAKVEAKLQRRYAKNEAKMDKYLQQARQGKLKYGKLSDDQVRQITDRLGMERSARSLGSAEKTWRQQKKEAFRKGKLSGIERGTAAAMEEVARAGTVFGVQHLINRMKLKSKAKLEGKMQKAKNKQINKKTDRERREEIDNKIKDEAYEMRVRENDTNGVENFLRQETAAQYLKRKNTQKRLAEEKRQRLQNDEKLRQDTYRQLVLGSKGHQKSQDEIIKAINDRGLYESLLGDKRQKYDQPVVKVTPMQRAKTTTTKLFNEVRTGLVDYRKRKYKYDNTLRG